MIIIDGIPGVGKTKTMVYLAQQQFRKANSKRLRKQRLKAKLNEKTPFVDNNGFYHFVFSNFPILLDKKHNIYTQKTSLYFFTFDYKFPPNSIHFIMEAQLPYDSTEYREFPELIAHYMQLHRHQMVDNIYLDSQSISRLPKYERIVASEWWRIIRSFKLPFLPIELKWYNSTYQLESDSGNSMLEGESKWDHHFKVIWNINKVHNAYDNLCMSALSENAKIIPFNMFTSLKMSKSDIRELHFRTQQEKQELAKRSLFD